MQEGKNKVRTRTAQKRRRLLKKASRTEKESQLGGNRSISTCERGGNGLRAGKFTLKTKAQREAGAVF